MESLELFEKLKTTVGEDVAFELVQIHKDKQDLSKLATKEDVIILRSDVAATKEEIQKEIAVLRQDITSFKTDITASVNRSTWLIGILITLAVVIIKFA